MQRWRRWRMALCKFPHAYLACRSEQGNPQMIDYFLTHRCICSALWAFSAVNIPD
jgi:hypothetical protein